MLYGLHNLVGVLYSKLSFKLSFAASYYPRAHDVLIHFTAPSAHRVVWRMLSSQQEHTKRPLKKARLWIVRPDCHTTLSSKDCKVQLIPKTPVPDPPSGHQKLIQLAVMIHQVESGMQ
jgi:hypothetical protein